MENVARRPNDVIDLAEAHSAGVAAFSYEGLQEARQRAASLLVVLLGGGSGLGGLGLTQWTGSKPIALAALFASAYWFAIAAYIAWASLRSASVRSWHTQGLLERWPKWDSYAKELVEEGIPATGIDELRKCVIRNMEVAAGEYREASTSAMIAIDRSFVLMACTPIVSIAAVILTA